VSNLSLPLVRIGLSSGGGFGAESGELEWGQQSQGPIGWFLNGGVGSSSVVTASLGSVRSSASVTVQPSAATSVDAVLVTSSGVWADSPVVNVAVRVHDDAFYVECSSTSVTVTVAPSSFSGSSVWKLRSIGEHGLLSCLGDVDSVVVHDGRKSDCYCFICCLAAVVLAWGL